jgi:2-amino-4-hydroxy-6-hydroxymethyldihydropteridine diphosphokinase
MARALIGLGSNVGDRAGQMNQAVELLRQTVDVLVVRISNWHETAPIGGPPGQGPFLNGAVLLETSLEPEQLHQALVQIENQLGRQRDVRWQARTIDLDLLLYDDLQLATPKLLIPHPRFEFRKFVVKPAAEIAPEMIHPTLRWTLKALHHHLHTTKPYVAITGPAGAGKTRLAAALAEHFAGRIIPSPRPSATANASSASGRALACELELLTERAALLVPWSWPAEAPLVTSDFWVDQSLAYGQGKLGLGELIELRILHSALNSSVVRPRLLVVLTGDAKSSRFETELAALLEPPPGPVLRMPAGDWDALWTEVTAAVTAML